MNEFSDLEAELKQMRPAAPSAALVTRIERALEEAATSTPSAGVLPRRPTVRFNWFTLGFGVAAAAAFLLLIRPNVERAPQKAPAVASMKPTPGSTVTRPMQAMVPDGLTRVVYNTRDEGLHFPQNSDQPMRRRRARSRETLQWKDSQTGASLRVSYPTEEVELIPVSGQ